MSKDEIRAAFIEAEKFAAERYPTDEVAGMAQAFVYVKSYLLGSDD